MKRRPLVLAALSFALGLSLPPAGRDAGVWVAGTAALALAFPPAAPLALAGAGWAVRGASGPRGSLAPAKREVVEGVVTSVPERLDDRVRFSLREDSGRILLAHGPALPWPLALGDRVRFPARLRTPEPARNPGGRDPAALLAARGIGLEASALSPPVRMAAPSLLAVLEEGRRRFAALATAILPPREAGLVRAIGAGDRDGVDAATNEAFARSGLAHVLSVSGLHLAVVAFGLERLVRALLLRCEPLAARTDVRRAAALVAIPLTAVYAVATGGSIPALRSAVAAAAAFAATLLDREREPLPTIALAALVILAFEPGALLDVSFQLSFASVAGLAIFTGPIRAALPVAPPAPGGGRGAWPGRAREALLLALCASAAATVATAPLVAFHFRRVSLAGLVANVPGVPLGSALTIFATAAALASSLAPPVAVGLLWLCRPIAWALLAVNDACAAPAWAAPGIAAPPLVAAATFYVLALLALRLRGARAAGCAVLATAILLAPGPTRRLAARARGGLEVVFVGVGQGDAVVLRLPDGSAVVVDGGGDPHGHGDPGARDVVPFLRDAGVSEIAAAFLSHPHPDHLGGMPSIHAALPFRRFFTGLRLAKGRAPPDDAAPALARLPRPEPFPPGAVFERAGVRFEALGPPADSEAWSENDASLVLRVTYGETVLLLPGDVEAEGEAALLASGPGLLASDLAKLPHHGSGTSSTPAFVAATHPRLAVACVGRDNRYGFPAPAVVARWHEAGARVLRTDGGAVRVLSDGRAIRVTPAASALDALALLEERP